MRPDQRWFPTSRVERAARFDLFAKTFPLHAAALRFTQADIDAVNADNAIVQYFAEAVRAADRYLKALRAAEKQLLFGRRGEPTPRIPPPPTVPALAVPVSGVFERFERLARQIRTMPAYNDAMGMSLGIVPKAPIKAEPARIAPKIRIEGGAQFAFEVHYVKRQIKLLHIELRRAGSVDWELIGQCTSSPAAVRVKPSVAGLPEIVFVRGRVVDGQVAVGNYSVEVPVTLLP